MASAALRKWVLVTAGVAVVAGLVAFFVMWSLARTSPREVRQQEAPQSDRPVDVPDAPERPARPSVAYSPPPVRDRGLTAFVDRTAKDRIPSDITSRMPRVSDPVDVRAVVSVLKDKGDNDTVRNEAANLLGRSGYRGLTGPLLDILRDPEEGSRFRSFAVQHLWHNAEKADAEERLRIVEALHEALSDKDIPVRREALLALVRLGDEKGREATVEWLTADKADGLRDAAIRCARELGLRELAPQVRQYLRDEDEVVRIAAVVTLAEWGDRKSRREFAKAAESDSVRLRRAGEAALKRLELDAANK